MNENAFPDQNGMKWFSEKKPGKFTRMRIQKQHTQTKFND